MWSVVVSIATHPIVRKAATAAFAVVVAELAGSKKQPLPPKRR